MTDQVSVSKLSTYDASFLKSKYGFSIIHFKNGVYQGSTYKNRCHGKGVFMWDNGEFYFGEWENNQINGEGIFFFSQGGYAKGYFFKHKLNGAAYLRFPNGDIYESFWRHGKLDGKCFKYFNENKTWALCEYEKGSFKKYLNSGKGKSLINFEDKLNTTNIENPSDKLFNKINVIKFHDGGKYYGYLDYDIPNGLGIIIYPEGKIDMGFFQNGILNGTSRIYFPNGDMYYGSVIEGHVIGQGFYYKKDTNKWAYGQFQDSKLIKLQNVGDGYPLPELEIFREKDHLQSDSYINEIINNDLFYVPIIDDKITSTSNSHHSSIMNNNQNLRKLSKLKSIKNKRVYDSNNHRYNINYEDDKKQKDIQKLLNDSNDISTSLGRNLTSTSLNRNNSGNHNNHSSSINDPKTISDTHILSLTSEENNFLNNKETVRIHDRMYKNFLFMQRIGNQENMGNQNQLKHAKVANCLQKGINLRSSNSREKMLNSQHMQNKNKKEESLPKKKINAISKAGIYKKAASNSPKLKGKISNLQFMDILNPINVGDNNSYSSEDRSILTRMSNNDYKEKDSINSSNISKTSSMNCIKNKSSSRISRESSSSKLNSEEKSKRAKLKFDKNIDESNNPIEFRLSLSDISYKPAYPQAQETSQQVRLSTTPKDMAKNIDLQTQESRLKGELAKYFEIKLEEYENIVKNDENDDPLKLSTLLLYINHEIDKDDIDITSLSNNQQFSNLFNFANMILDQDIFNTYDFIHNYQQINSKLCHQKDLIAEPNNYKTKIYKLIQTMLQNKLMINYNSQFNQEYNAFNDRKIIFKQVARCLANIYIVKIKKMIMICNDNKYCYNLNKSKADYPTKLKNSSGYMINNDRVETPTEVSIDINGKENTKLKRNIGKSDEDMLKKQELNYGPEITNKSKKYEAYPEHQDPTQNLILADKLSFSLPKNLFPPQNNPYILKHQVSNDSNSPATPKGFGAPFENNEAPESESSIGLVYDLNKGLPSLTRDQMKSRYEDDNLYNVSGDSLTYTLSEAFMPRTRHESLASEPSVQRNHQNECTTKGSKNLLIDCIQETTQENIASTPGDIASLETSHIKTIRNKSTPKRTEDIAKSLEKLAIYLKSDRLRKYTEDGDSQSRSAILDSEDTINRQLTLKANMSNSQNEDGIFSEDKLKTAKISVGCAEISTRIEKMSQMNSSKVSIYQAEGNITGNTDLAMQEIINQENLGSSSMRKHDFTGKTNDIYLEENKSFETELSNDTLSHNNSIDTTIIGIEKNIEGSENNSCKKLLNKNIYHQDNDNTGDDYKYSVKINSELVDNIESKHALSANNTKILHSYDSKRNIPNHSKSTDLLLDSQKKIIIENKQTKHPTQNFIREQSEFKQNKENHLKTSMYMTAGNEFKTRLQKCFSSQQVNQNKFIDEDSTLDFNGDLEGLEQSSITKVNNLKSLEAIKEMKYSWTETKKNSKIFNDISSNMLNYFIEQKHIIKKDNELQDSKKMNNESKSSILCFIDNDISNSESKSQFFDQTHEKNQFMKSIIAAENVISQGKIHSDFETNTQLLRLTKINNKMESKSDYNNSLAYGLSNAKLSPHQHSIDNRINSTHQISTSVINESGSRLTSVNQMDEDNLKQDSLNMMMDSISNLKSAGLIDKIEVVDVEAILVKTNEIMKSSKLPSMQHQISNRSKSNLLEQPKNEMEISNTQESDNIIINISDTKKNSITSDSLITSVAPSELPQERINQSEILERSITRSKKPSRQRARTQEKKVPEKKNKHLDFRRSFKGKSNNNPMHVGHNDYNILHQNVNHSVRSLGYNYSENIPNGGLDTNSPNISCKNLEPPWEIYGASICSQSNVMGDVHKIYTQSAFEYNRPGTNPNKPKILTRNSATDRSETQTNKFKNNFIKKNYVDKSINNSKFHVNCSMIDLSSNPFDNISDHNQPFTTSVIHYANESAYLINSHNNIHNESQQVDTSANVYDLKNNRLSVDDEKSKLLSYQSNNSMVEFNAITEFSNNTEKQSYANRPIYLPHFRIESIDEQREMSNNIISGENQEKYLKPDNMSINLSNSRNSQNIQNQLIPKEFENCRSYYPPSEYNFIQPNQWNNNQFFNETSHSLKTYVEPGLQDTQKDFLHSLLDGSIDNNSCSEISKTYTRINPSKEFSTFNLGIEQGNMDHNISEMTKIHISGSPSPQKLVKKDLSECDFNILPVTSEAQTEIYQENFYDQHSNVTRLIGRSQYISQNEQNISSIYDCVNQGFNTIEKSPQKKIQQKMNDTCSPNTMQIDRSAKTEPTGISHDEENIGFPNHTILNKYKLANLDPIHETNIENIGESLSHRYSNGTPNDTIFQNISNINKTPNRKSARKKLILKPRNSIQNERITENCFSMQRDSVISKPTMLIEYETIIESSDPYRSVGPKPKEERIYSASKKENYILGSAGKLKTNFENVHTPSRFSSSSNEFKQELIESSLRSIKVKNPEIISNQLKQNVVEENVLTGRELRPSLSNKPKNFPAQIRDSIKENKVSVLNNHIMESVNHKIYRSNQFHQEIKDIQESPRIKKDNCMIFQ